MRKKPSRYIKICRPGSGGSTGGRAGVDRILPAVVYNLRLPTEGLRQGHGRVAGARIKQERADALVPPTPCHFVRAGVSFGAS